jgi:two-component system, chemotaxis family, protein-glutamate methylesterase/glutaminase
MGYEAIVIGVPSGGMKAMKIMFSHLPKGFKTPLLIVQHISAQSDSQWIQLLNDTSNVDIKEVDEKEKIENANVYFAPPNYQLLIEKNKTFSLSIEEKVNYARPSIDVLFESAADAYTNKLIGIILTSSNNSRTNGIKRIQECGGSTIVQDPKTAEAPSMPLSAIQLDYILSLEDIIEPLIKLDKQTH